MGTKHNKKRYLVVKYKAKPDKKFGELVEMSKKKIGAGKMAEAAIVLDLKNQKVLKCNLPGVDENIEYGKVYAHFQKYYGDAISEFMKS